MRHERRYRNPFESLRYAPALRDIDDIVVRLADLIIDDLVTKDVIEP